jgi:hypothetical protein
MFVHQSYKKMQEHKPFKECLLSEYTWVKNNIKKEVEKLFVN